MPGFPRKPRRVQEVLDEQVRLILCGIAELFPSQREKMHAHPFWELVYVISGNATVGTGDGEEAAGPQNLFLIPPHVRYECVNGYAEAFKSFYVGFSFPDFPVSVTHTHDIRVLSGMPSVRLLKAEIGEIATAWEEQQTLSRHAPAALRVLCDIKEFLTTVYPRHRVTANRESPNITHVKRFVYDCLDRPISSDELRDLLHVPFLNIDQEFKNETGCTIRQYHHQLRMERSFRLLKETDLNVSEVANRLGFDTVQYFSRCFRAYFQISPKMVRVNTSR